jgi:hypothetical protein
MTMVSDHSEGDHYDAVLADLEAQIIQLQAAIVAIKAVRGGMRVPPGVGIKNPPAGLRHEISAEIAIDTFHKLTVAQGIKKFLGMGPKKPVTTQEIVDALRAGGQSGSEGTNFTVVVNNSLNRMARADGDISKVRRGVWGLKAWYDNKTAE